MLRDVQVLITSLLLCLAFIATAQTQLTGGQTAAETPMSTPSLTDLDVSWWQYFAEVGAADVFDQRLEQFVQGISKTIETVQQPEAMNKELAVINELFNQYQKQKFMVAERQQKPDKELQDNYSIQELIDLNTAKNAIINAEEKNQQAADAISKQIIVAKNNIDKLKVSYYDGTEDLRQQYIAGLQWIDARIRMALDELRYERLQLKAKDIKAELAAQQTLIAQASERLVLKKESNAVADVERIKEQQAKNQIEIEQLNLQLAQDFTDTDEARLNSEIDRLKLAQALIEDAEYRLLLNKNQQIQFLQTHLDPKSVNPTDLKTLRSLIVASDELLSQLDEQLQDWQRVSQDTLLQPIPDQSEVSNKIYRLIQQKRTLAQEVLTAHEDLIQLKSENSFNLELLKTRMNEVVTGFSKTWYQIKAYAASGKEIMTNLIYNPLFTVNDYPVTLLPLIKLLLIILIGYLVSKAVTYVIKRYEKKHNIDKVKNRSSLYLMHTLVHYFIIFIAAMAGFSTLGINLSNITLIAGALSVGIGFGLQNLVSNFVSGLTIMFEKTLSVGDYIELEDGTTGVVKEIKARSTRLNTNDNIDVIIPNSDMVTNKVINWTLKESIRRIKIPFGVAYGTDKELVKKAALEAAENVKYTLTNMPGKEPDVWMMEFGDSSVNFILLVWVAHFGLRRPNRIKSYYMWELDTALNKYGIEIPFPQRDVNLNVVNKQLPSMLDESVDT